jgi:hypothetical protein
MRHIKPEYATHEVVNEMSITARYAETYTWCHADIHGRFEWKPKTLKLHVLPFNDVDFESLMLEWVQHGFVERYEVDGQKYGRFINWEKHQYINPHETSEFPTPPAQASTCENVPARASTTQIQRDKDKERENERENENENEIETVTHPSGWASGNSKSKAKSGQGIANELWTELQTSYRAADITSVFPALVKTGLPKIRAFINAGKYPQAEVLAAWTYWLINKYRDQLDADVPIKFPLSVFADDVEAQILCIRKEQAEIAEPVTN